MAGKTATIQRTLETQEKLPANGAKDRSFVHFLQKKSAKKAAAEAELAAEKEQYAKRVAKRKEEVSVIDQIKEIPKRRPRNPT